MTNSGIGYLEVLAALAILGVLTLLPPKIISARKPPSKNTLAIEAVKEIEDAVALALFEKLSTYVRWLATSQCRYNLGVIKTWSPTIIWTHQSVYAPGFELQILDRNHSHEVRPPIQRQTEFAQAIQRCQHTTTFYSNHRDALEDQSDMNGFYLCVLIRRHQCPTRRDSLPLKIAELTSSAPVLIEAQLSPIDPGSGRRIKCSEVKKGWPEGSLGILEYRYHWSPATYSLSGTDTFLDYSGTYAHQLGS